MWYELLLPNSIAEQLDRFKWSTRKGMILKAFLSQENDMETEAYPVRASRCVLFQTESRITPLVYLTEWSECLKVLVQERRRSSSGCPHLGCQSAVARHLRLVAGNLLIAFLFTAGHWGDVEKHRNGRECLKVNVDCVLCTWRSVGLGVCAGPAFARVLEKWPYQLVTCEFQVYLLEFGQQSSQSLWIFSNYMLLQVFPLSCRQ